MIVLIDLDDVVWDMLSLWVFYINKFYGTKVKVEDIQTWDIQKYFPDLTKDQLTDILSLDSFWHYIKPYDEAIEYINKLNDLDIDIYFVTATDPRNVFFKYNILRKYFGFVDLNNLIICHKKNLVKGDILIDDNIDNLTDRKNGILFSTPANKNINISEYGENISRANSWKDVYMLVSSLYMIEKLN